MSGAFSLRVTSVRVVWLLAERPFVLSVQPAGN